MEFTAQSGTVYALCYACLGRGKFAHVRVGINKNTDARVALKVIESCDDEIRAKVHHERDILLKLQGHQGIIRLLDYAEVNNDVMLVFEKHPRTLFDFVFNGGHLGQVLQLDACRRVFRGIVDALAFCRKSNISHLDLKLENIMMDNDNSPVLIDFGFAEEVEAGEKLTCARGSFNYISPEIVAQLPFEPEKADVWSLGCILYAMTTGLLPFRHPTNSVPKTLERIVNGQYELPDGTSPDLADLLSHLLDKSPDTRFTLAQVLAHPFCDVDAVPESQ
eukprot:TRINITY_DN680_c0_g1_i2.p1 TRINITY_DN680_c0_g1~~TRINITY_DN680_c0_g1_i2.p1  ORF type:complete len:277 (-),score=90.88 TRINITY_DN680_c0_g1_i2:544-1374(-)